ncbi:uncharacterized protein Z520_01470 [Fonsecaea multimorphosa CBS 102226]|uniref:Secreted protein n=1 Tax=Fonsecaea multimorphosa CBS 102226 TaxID=1442371 RepID=A0A0D2L1S8_9EURO|nr:uncharacterized protein Z520_01470 [Fonsecaea multimorphosa CBS 102226]KIY03004.1 hypothetical protein Z520_01470 [Fonsecaea multimorphosa CBS 102226]OAL30834.1 hypothetical protein AYO22_01454 [Fonsecaea multimorphosa]
MKFLTTTLTALTLSLSLASASFIGDLNARGLEKMDGKCTSKGGCKVPGGLHSAYSCWNSKCNVTTSATKGDEGKNCTIAPGMDGEWVAKCPTNLLPYEWEWPWVPPKKDN